MIPNPTSWHRTSRRLARRRTRIRSVAPPASRIVAAAVALAATLHVAPAGAVQAAASTVEGVGAFNAIDGFTCPEELPGYPEFTSYDPIALAGSLRGCWYTNVDESTVVSRPSGVYYEEGKEIFVGSVNGGPVGTFTTTYKFEAKYGTDGVEVKGRCQHPITPGSGTGGLTGITGRVNFKDIVTTNPPTYTYRGHVSLP